MFWGEYYILLEGYIVLLYILNTVVKIQNIIFQRSAQTENQNVFSIHSRVERKGKTIKKVIKEGTKTNNGIVLVEMIGSCISGHAVLTTRIIRENFNEAIKRFMGSSHESEQQ